MSLKDLFLLDPEVTYLNHGSFGACPSPVFEVYRYWQTELERQPTELLGRKITAEMEKSRRALAAYLDTRAEDVVYFPNPTTAINMVARSLNLHTGDEILATDHEYGAMDRTWRFIASKSGARYTNYPIRLPLADPQEFIEQFWTGITSATKIIFISHITSPTSLNFPVNEICRRARQSGIITIVDGAHAPGHIPLSLFEIDADIYTGALHKWLCAPKGAAFLYARREIQSWLEPLVVSWGYGSDNPSGSRFIDYHEWQGTRDMSAYLSVPAAIQFQEDHNWDAVRQRCHELARFTSDMISAQTGLPQLSDSDAHNGDSHQWFGQMVSIPLPKIDGLHLKNWLYNDLKIEVPVIYHQNRWYLRTSFQAYNAMQDAEKLIQAIKTYLHDHI